MLYPFLIIAGLAIIAAGFYATHNAKKPWDSFGAISLPLGMVMTLFGVLLTAVPNFFAG